MRGFVSYLVGGILAVLALDLVVPLGLGMSVSAWPSIESDRTMVNRSAKGDRLPIPAITVRKPNVPQQQPVLIGCEPAFSPLSASARLNFPGRCMAALTASGPA